MEIKVESYHFAPDFERAIVTMLCMKQSFYGRIGYGLESEALSNEFSKLAVEAAQAIGRESGSGPGQGFMVIQRLKRWMHDGKVTWDQVCAVNDLLDKGENNLPSEEQLINELTPILKHRIQKDAARAALENYSQKGDFSRVQDLIRDAERLGKADTNIGLSINGTFDALDEIKKLDRLPTGIGPLDSVLEGGLNRGGMGVVMGSEGSGKSLFLAHVTAHNVKLGHNVVLATLEISEQLQLARIVANLTAIPIDSITNNSDMRELAKQKLQKMGNLGNLSIKYFTPQATTVEDIEIWLEHCEQLKGKIELIVIDYGDKLFAPKAKREYDAGLIVFEGLRILAEKRNCYLWTASQSQRLNRESRKKQDTSHAADSIHKPRIADLWITLNSVEGGIRYFVGKNRTGMSRMDVGPLPTEFEIGRMAPLYDDDSSIEMGVIV